MLQSNKKIRRRKDVGAVASRNSKESVEILAQSSH